MTSKPPARIGFCLLAALATSGCVATMPPHDLNAPSPQQIATDRFVDTVLDVYGITPNNQPAS